jgi:hypothetical protein
VQVLREALETASLHSGNGCENTYNQWIADSLFLRVPHKDKNYPEPR